MGILLPVSAAGDSAKQAANAGISVMLLGSVTFMMGLFYLVNHRNPELVKYSWQVISATISIFSAVLLFQGFNGVVEVLVVRNMNESVELFVAMAQFLFWFSLLQWALARISGALRSGFQEPTLEEEEVIEQRLKCYAVLLGHITGFAAIHAFGVLQQQIPHRFIVSSLVAPIAWIIVYLLSQIMTVLRDYIARSDDGYFDRCETLWDEETRETEDDIVGLVVSFMGVQALRLGIGGDLPNIQGEEPWPQCAAHPDMQVLVLEGFGFLFFVAEFMRIMVYIKKAEARPLQQIRQIVVTSAAWCWYFGTDWLLSYNFFRIETGMMKDVLVALWVTASALAAILVLDHISDMPTTDAIVKHAIRIAGKSLGLLIGFGWERAFETAIVTLSSQCEEIIAPAATKLILAILLSALVVPAWRLFILPRILEFDRQDEAMMEELENEVAEALSYCTGSLQVRANGDEEEPKVVPMAVAADSEREAIAAAADLTQPLLYRERSLRQAWKLRRANTAFSCSLWSSQASPQGTPTFPTTLSPRSTLTPRLTPRSARLTQGRAREAVQMSSQATQTAALPRMSTETLQMSSQTSQTPPAAVQAEGGSPSAAEALETRRRCQDFAAHVRVLEARNSQLEASLGSITEELAELQRLSKLQRGKGRRAGPRVPFDHARAQQIP